jgi:hypothetical protein
METICTDTIKIIYISTSGIWWKELSIAVLYGIGLAKNFTMKKEL